MRPAYLTKRALTPNWSACTANARADNKAGLPTQGREHLGFAKLAHLVLASNLQAIRSKR
jgi:hypothetical protein